MRAFLLLCLLVASANAFRLSQLVDINQPEGLSAQLAEEDDDCPPDLREPQSDFPGMPEHAGDDEDRPGPGTPHPGPPHPPPKPGHRHPHGPPFYHGLPGPRFRVLNRTCGYQVRGYNSSSWASTRVESWSWGLAVHKGFGVLASYFTGNNANHSHFPPSVPLLSHYIPKNNFSDGGKEFIISAFIPQKCNDTSKPPAPLSDNIKVRSFPPTEIYVRQYGGLDFAWSALRESFALARALKRNKVNVTEGMFFAAQYDGPATLFHRHNEIWFVPKPSNASAVGSDVITNLWSNNGLALNSPVIE